MKPGDIIKVLEPYCSARITEVRVLPNGMIEKELPPWAPAKPPVFIRFEYLDGLKRGQKADAVLHPDDKIMQD